MFHNFYLDIEIITKLQITIRRELVKTSWVSRDWTFGEDTRMITTPWALEGPSVIPVLRMLINVRPITITRKKAWILHGSHPLTSKHDFCWPQTFCNEKLRLQCTYAVQLNSPIVSMSEDLSSSLFAVCTTLWSVYFYEPKTRRFKLRTERQKCCIVL